MGVEISWGAMSAGESRSAKGYGVLTTRRSSSVSLLGSARNVPVLGGRLDRLLGVLYLDL